MDIQRVKFCLGRTVYFEGIPYTFTGCIMRQGNKSGFAFQAELKDQTSAATSFVIAKLEDVSEKQSAT